LKKRFEFAKNHQSLPEMKVALISLAHCATDLYASFLATFIPFIKENLRLSYSLAGNFNLIVGVFHIVCQPVVGYVCDRVRGAYLIAAGPILCGLGAIMLPNTNSYAAAIFFAGIWGLGSALYHPQGAGGIGYVSSRERLTQSLTWYNIGGTVGTMLSPLIAVRVVKILGYKGLFVTLVPALLLAVLVYFFMPFLRDEPVRMEHRRGFFKTFGALFTALYPLWAISLIRDLLFQCMRFFLPLKIAAEGGDLESVGTIVFCLTLGSSLGMIPMGKLAKRCGIKRALQGSLIAGTIILSAGILTAGLIGIAFYLLGIACIYSTLPLTVTLAQNLAPNERGSASSIVMGLAWGFGNILIFPVGFLADWLGLESAFIFMAILPLAGIPFFRTAFFKNMA
jgi:FSR family fosmidomycin resistance protein-like MFS transporter